MKKNPQPNITSIWYDYSEKKSSHSSSTWASSRLVSVASPVVKVTFRHEPHHCLIIYWFIKSAVLAEKCLVLSFIYLSIYYKFAFCRLYTGWSSVLKMMWRSRRIAVVLIALTYHRFSATVMHDLFFQTALPDRILYLSICFSQGERKMNGDAAPPTITMALINPQAPSPQAESKQSSIQQLSISVWVSQSLLFSWMFCIWFVTAKRWLLNQGLLGHCNLNLILTNLEYCSSTYVIP